ncbi:MAG: hypothetical protein K1X74_20740 [Pirellulales bacterium]|nr:hypothetical protein [Pirellulales bacterium]
MAIVLHMRPQLEPMYWNQFCAATEPFAIALDGYVAAGPRFQAEGPRLNLNHHTEVDRLATRSTCAQVLLAIRQGLFTRFRDENGPRADIYCNDCDEDVCTSWFLLKHSYLAGHTMNPVLNRLVVMEDLLDATAGAYPFPVDLPILQELAWVYEPYRRTRLDGQLDLRDPEVCTRVVYDVEDRIMRYVTGRGKSIPLDTHYERTGGGHGWAMIREIGDQARTGVFADGIQAYVAARKRRDGRWSYTIGRMSPFIPFDVPAILEALNVAEGATTNRWNGDNTTGTSPRVSGSRLSPDDVTRVIEDVLRKRGA